MIGAIKGITLRNVLLQENGIIRDENGLLIARLVDSVKFDDIESRLAENLVSQPSELTCEPIHEWFGLSYAQYLTMPRSVLQSMPKDWQQRFVELLHKTDETNWDDYLPEQTMYKVELRRYRYNHKDEFCWGKEKINDPLADYERGRRIVNLASNRERRTG